MKSLFLFFLLNATILHAQNPPDTLQQKQVIANADDPSNFLTRMEVFNEMQRYDKSDVYLNQSVIRTIVKIGKRFTTRMDIPLVYNSFTSPANYQQFGLGDISFRLLGYQILNKPISVITASIEVSLNTAESRLLGTGKTVLLPVLTYSQLFPKQKLLFAAVFQQANSVSGNEERADLSFSKLQLILLKRWSPRFWTVLAPEWYLDYVNGGMSMNLRTRLTHAPTPRLNLWITPSVGIFGDFVGRYQWSIDVGGRYFFLREMRLRKKK